MNLDERIVKALKRIAEHYPDRDDLIFFTPGSDAVLAGTALTVTFVMRRDFQIAVSELYCDARADCTYSWTFAGVRYEFNEVSFSFPKRIRGGDPQRIVLRIENRGISDVEVGYCLKGWARRL